MIYPKEYLDLQVTFAERQAILRHIPLAQAILGYTGISRSFNLRHDQTGSGNLNWATYENRLGSSNDPKQTTYEYYLAQQAHPFPQETRYKFGCFSCSDPVNGLVRVHFSNHDDSMYGPLSKERLPNRLAELTNMFRLIKGFSGVNLVGGFSWLYNLEAYKRLFPKEFGKSGKVKEWYGSLALWGQFLDSSSHLRQATATAFLNCIAFKTEPTCLFECFQFKPLETRCAIDKFYEFYNL